MTYMHMYNMYMYMCNMYMSGAHQSDQCRPP